MSGVAWTGRARRLVAVAAVSAFALSACDFDGAYDLPLPGSPVSADDSYTVTAEFADILNVVPRSPIMVDDVTVGEVTEVDRDGWHARIQLRVRDDVVLPDNVVAEIRQVSLLGEKYVALEPPEDVPATGQLGEGDVITLDRTGRNPEVEEVLGALSFLLSGGGVAQLGSITQELNNAMSGRTGELKGVLGSLESVIGTLDEQKLDILDALESLNNLTATLNAERETVEGALDVAGPAIEVLGDQHDELVQMLSSLDRLGVVGTRVVRASKDDLLDSLRELQPVLRNLSAAGDELAPGLNLLVSFPFPQEASEIVLGDYANTSIRADINLDNLLPGLQLPDLLPDLPGVPDLDVVLDCLTSADVTSRACSRVLSSLNLLPALIKDCKRPKFRSNPVCRALGLLSGGSGGGGGGGLLPGLPDLPGLLGLGRLSTALSSGEASRPASTIELLGGTP